MQERASLLLDSDPNQYKLLQGPQNQVQWRLAGVSHVKTRCKSSEAAWNGPFSGNHTRRGSCNVLLHTEPALPCATHSELHSGTNPSSHSLSLWLPA